MGRCCMSMVNCRVFVVSTFTHAVGLGVRGRQGGLDVGWVVCHDLMYKLSISISSQ